jgi:cell division protein FtsQ
MERSLATLIARPFGLPALGRPGGSGAGRGSASRSTGATRGTTPRSSAQQPALPRRLLIWLQRTVGLLWGSRRSRIALIALLIALPVLGGGYLILRNSPFVAVEHVQISGVSGTEASAIEGALSTAAKHMSTLEVNAGALQAAVAPFRVVSSIRAQAIFPHGLRIEVTESLPVAALIVDGQRTGVSAAGVVLGPALASSSLPTLTGYLQLPPGAHLHNATLLESVAVLAAAPSVLAKHVSRVYESSEGLTLAMGNGLLVYFGDAVRPHAKWLSLARVLADHSSAGASYIDVRLPSRPAAGFPAGAGPASSSTSEELSSTQSGNSSESTVGALAAGLSKETGATASTPATSSSSTSSSEPSSEAKTNSGTSGESSESATAPASEGSQEAAAPPG